MFVYIIENTNTKGFYIGITDNLERRLKGHNSNNHHFTGKTEGEWKLIFQRRFIDKAEARREEIRLKRCKSRHYLEWYIKHFGAVAQR